MRRKALAALAVVAGIGVAALSATAMWPDGAATAGSGPTRSTSPTVSSALPTAPTTRSSEQVQPGRRSSEQVRPGRPKLLRLPALGVAAPVSRIGSEGSLNLTPPDDYSTVGWWSLGPEPGSPVGTAIIAGHTVHTGGGALDDLEQMKVGDRVELARRAGKLAYTVSSVRTYSKGKLAAKAEKIFAQDSPGRLAVVTCEDWTGTVYLSNVVVIASDPRMVGRGTS